MLSLRADWCWRVAAVVVLGWLVGAAYAVTPTVFTQTNPPLGGGPIGFTYAGNKFVGSILGDGTGRLYSTDLTGGSIQPFGGTVNLAASYGQEHYVAASLGLGGFPSWDVYVAEGNNIRHITNAGVADPGLFITGSLGGVIGDVRGIAFDAVGTFGNKMLVTTHDGYVYTVDNTGNPTQIAWTKEDTEGLDVAPLGAGAKWGPYAGSLFVASEGSGKIRAIDPNTFAMTDITTVASAEQLAFVPLNLGASGNPLEGLYSANYSVNVLHMGASEFAGMQGDIIVTGEMTGVISNITATNGLSVTVSSAGVFSNQPEDGIFVTADMVVPEAGTAGLLGVGAALLLARRRKPGVSGA